MSEYPLILVQWGRPYAYVGGPVIIHDFIRRLFPHLHVCTALKPMVSNITIENNTVWQGDNGWSIMLGWNGPGGETSSVRHVHVIHVGHNSDGYCYPCLHRGKDQCKVWDA